MGAHAPQLESPGRVLVVDDDPRMRISVEGLLIDFEVSVAANVGEAETLLRSAEFDVVLTDYEMPGGTGVQLAQLIQQKFPSVMVILLTGHSELSEIQESENTQTVVRVLAKPYNPTQLIRWVSQSVKLSRMQRAMANVKARGKREGLLLKVTYPEHEGEEACLTNLSMGGCFIRTERAVQVGEIIDLSISFPQALDPLPLRAEVCWRAPKQPGNSGGVGVSFRDLSPSAVETLGQLTRKPVAKPGAATPSLQVLFLEPDDSRRKVYRDYLAQLDPAGTSQANQKLNLIWVADVQACLTQLGEQRAQAVILDADFLNGGALALVSRIRALPGHERLPLVVLHALGSRPPAPDPWVMCVSKPVSLDSLFRTLQVLWDRQ